MGHCGSSLLCNKCDSIKKSNMCDYSSWQECNHNHATKYGLYCKTCNCVLSYELLDKTLDINIFLCDCKNKVVLLYDSDYPITKYSITKKIMSKKYNLIDFRLDKSIQSSDYIDNLKYLISIQPEEIFYKFSDTGLNIFSFVY